MRLGIALICATTLAAIAAPVASAQQAAPPNPRPVTQDGPSGRYMLDGQWLLRVDRGDRGAGQHWERRRSTRGWTPVTIPNAWNANDRTPNGFIGSARVVSARLPPAVAREGPRLGGPVRLGQLPRERVAERHAGSAATPADSSRSSCRSAALKRGGLNRLVVRVDNRRLPTDFPPTTYTQTERASRRLVELRRDRPRGLPASASTGLRLTA